MISKWKINEKFQNEEKVKKSERKTKHELEIKKVTFETQRIQAEERKLKMK